MKVNCFVCSEPLSNRGLGLNPENALVFQGGPGYDSRFDNDFVELGLRGYVLFICDECWAAHRELAFGYKVIQPPSHREYIPGKVVREKLNALALKAWAKRVARKLTTEGWHAVTECIASGKSVVFAAGDASEDCITLSVEQAEALLAEHDKR